MWNNFFRPSKRATFKPKINFLFSLSLCVCLCCEWQQGKFPGQSKDWVLDPGELEAAFSSKTKMIIVNNPNNPLGKVIQTLTPKLLHCSELPVG